MYHDTFADRNQEATVWVGNIDTEVDEELLVELMMQAGPVMSINMPRDKITGSHQGFAFIEFRSEADADYAMKTMNMIRLIGKTIKINKATREEGEQNIGANLFIGNLDPDVDEQLLYTTFTAFGQVVAAKVMHDEIDGKSKGFGFVNFSDFTSADNALQNMNGQFLCNRPITVSFAYKKGETGSNPLKHGGNEERRIASLAGPITTVNTKFAASGPVPTGLMAKNLTPHGGVDIPTNSQPQQTTQLPPMPLMVPGGNFSFPLPIPSFGFPQNHPGQQNSSQTIPQNLNQAPPPFPMPQNMIPNMISDGSMPINPNQQSEMNRNLSENQNLDNLQRNVRGSG